MFLSQKYYDMLRECHFRITDLVMISFRYCAENAVEIPQRYRGQTVENTTGNLWVSYAKRSVYNALSNPKNNINARPAPLPVSPLQDQC